MFDQLTELKSTGSCVVPLELLSVTIQLNINQKFSSIIVVSKIYIHRIYVVNFLCLKV